MRETSDLLRHERRARIFFLALAQSALGTGAGYIALLLIAEARFESPWAISLVLIADLIPSMLLGPLFGAAADRWSRKRCAVVADVIRVVAFAGIALVDSFEGTVAFAAVAGIGTGLFTPAALASLPSVLDDERRLPAATSLYGAVADLGFTVGPALAFGVLLFGGPETLIWVNAATFALSGLLLVPLRFGEAPKHPVEIGRPSLFADAREGMRVTAGASAIRVVLLASAVALFGAGLFNIAELFYVTGDLGKPETVFPVLVAFFGVGFVFGSLAGSKGGDAPFLKQRYLASLVVLGIGFAATGLTGSYVVALATFAVAGFGNGMMLVYERLLIQHSFADHLVGRVFGIRDALTAWAFAIAFIAGGGLVTAVGPSETILIAGGVGFAVAATAALALRGEWLDEGPDLPPGGAIASGESGGAKLPVS
jgi:MFS family permease